MDDPACMGLLQLISSLINNESSDQITDKILESHRHFDPAKIPKHSILNHTRQDQINISRAKFSLRVITSSPLAADILSQPRVANALKEAWPNIWQWVVFMHERCVVNRAHGGLETVDQIALTARVPIFVAVTDELRNVVTATPGLAALLGKHWLQEGSDEYYKSGRRDRPFTVAFQRLFQEKTHLYKEVVQIAKGGVNTVIRLSVEHLRAVLSEKPLELMLLLCHLRLIVDLMEDRSFQLALLSNKLIPTLVNALTLCASHPEPTDNSLVQQNIDSCYLLLKKSLISTNGLSWAVQAIECGLLPAVLKSGRWMASDTKLAERSSRFLSVILYKYLIFRSVLRAVAKAFEKHHFSQISDDRTAIGPLWEAWMSFKTLAEDRLKKKAVFDEKVENGKYAHGRCNRMECSKTDDETFRRCSGCLYVYYCSTTCQKSDWPIHRESCKLGQHSLLTGAGRPLSRNDTSFIHSLVQQDVYTNLELVVKLLQDRKTSASDLNCFLLDYTAVPMKVRFGTLEVNSAHEFDLGAEEQLRLVRDFPDDLILVQAWVQNGISEARLAPSIMDLTGLREDKANDLLLGKNK